MAWPPLLSTYYRAITRPRSGAMLTPIVRAAVIPVHAATPTPANIIGHLQSSPTAAFQKCKSHNLGCWRHPLHTRPGR
ncbi:hypothetical protein BDW66DRAFT_139955 [Aspergillus desertorum]